MTKWILRLLVIGLLFWLGNNAREANNFADAENAAADSLRVELDVAFDKVDSLEIANDKLSQINVSLTENIETYKALLEQGSNYDKATNDIRRKLDEQYNLMQRLDTLSR